VRWRRGPRLPSGLTFGGRVPAAVGLLLALMVVGSVAGYVTRRADLFAFSPTAIVRGELWRLVAWPWVSDPLTLLFAGLLLWSMGAQLTYAWGEGRFLVRSLVITVGASLGATLLALVWGAADAPHLGIWPLANALLLSWAMLHPDAQVSLMMVLPVTGRTLGLLVVFGTVLWGLAAGGIAGLGAFALHLFALAVAWVLSRGRLPTRRWKMPLRDWWSEREFRRRAKHLKVIRKDGSDEPPRWLN